jgi:hypothetical protein
MWCFIVAGVFVYESISPGGTRAESGHFVPDRPRGFVPDKAASANRWEDAPAVAPATAPASDLQAEWDKATPIPLPRGAVVSSDGKVTLPDGRSYELNNRDPSTGRLLKPWEIDWSKKSAGPETSTPRWVRLVTLLLALPVLIWLAIEYAVWVGGWVKRGFKGGGQ